MKKRTSRKKPFKPVYLEVWSVFGSIIICRCVFDHSGKCYLFIKLIIKLFSAEVSLWQCPCIQMKKIVTDTRIQSLKSSGSLALAGVAERIECRLINWKVACLIPSWGTCLGCGPSPLLRVCERQLINVSLAHQCFSPSLSPSLPSSLKINKEEKYS